LPGHDVENITLENNLNLPIQDEEIKVNAQCKPGFGVLIQVPEKASSYPEFSMVWKPVPGIICEDHVSGLEMKK